MEAQAKAKAREDFWLQASQKPKRPLHAADLYFHLKCYKPPLPLKEMTVQWHVTSLLFQSYHRLLPYSDEAPDYNPREKKVHPMLRHCASHYADTQLARRMLFS